ncbi:MAG: hypothetical protein IJ759_02525 [Bacteroidales bacterium]|nr:hypothetical protein [Bacteroidales bacterium]
MKKILVALAAVVCALTLNAQENNQTKSCNNNEKSCCSETKSCCKKVSPHHFTMSLGYGFSLSEDHDALLLNYNSDSDHNSKMRHGIDYRFDYDYNFHKNFAAGAVFNMYNSFDSYYAGDKSLGSSSDDRWLFYVGPSFTAHTDLIKEHYTLFAKATAGYLNFRNAQRALVNTTDAYGNQTTTIASTTYKRATFGYGLSLGMSYLLSKYFSIDCSLGYLGGSVSKLKAADNTFDLDENENLSRINLNVGVKIKL